MRISPYRTMTLATILMLALHVASANAAEPDVANGMNAFALDLYKQMAPQPGNLFFSPASISTAFGMAYLGARGKTAEQLAKVLHFDASAQKTGAESAALLKQWNAPDKEYQLAVANALWGQQGYPFAPAFNAELQADYGAGLHSVDFRQTEQARQTINQWIEDQTQHKIRELIPSGGIDAATRMVLTNAVYFKAAWDHQFQAPVTHPGPFTLADDTKVQAPMMRQMDRFAYLKADDFSAIQMNYAHGQVSMLVFLPENATGLGAFEKNLSEQNLNGWINQLRDGRSSEVRLSFPKFKITYASLLGRVLSKMGMPLVFGGGADFSGMNNGTEPLSIGEAFHKAYVDVNEQGTEAAAATGIVMRATALPTNVVTFTADHPFFFLIRDNQSGAILFMGKVVNPGD